MAENAVLSLHSLEHKLRLAGLKGMPRLSSSHSLRHLGSIDIFEDYRVPTDMCISLSSTSALPLSAVVHSV